MSHIDAVVPKRDEQQAIALKRVMTYGAPVILTNTCRGARAR
jgi:hypothetical protein